MATLNFFEIWARRRRISLSLTFSACFHLTLFLVLCIQIQQGDGARHEVDRECKSIANLVKGKNFTYPWWEDGYTGRERGQSQVTPLPPSFCTPGRNGDKGTRCCRELNSTLQKKEMGDKFTEKWLGPKLAANGDIFKERKKKFDVTFKDLLTRAHAAFDAMFERTYGMLYIQHAPIFHALFTTLTSYYDTGIESLEGKLNEFFAILTRKMFVVLNSQYEFDDTYLSCATIVISEKQGGDLHRHIVSSLRRSFVATRALAQGLNDADRVFNNLQKLKTAPECASSLSIMLQCPICSETRAFKPCTPLCTGITSQCLAVMGPLVKSWTDFTNSMENVLDRLLGPYNVEAVVEPIHIKISEAIMNFQESGPDLSQAVFAKCGKPKLKSSKTFRKREASHPPPETLRRRPEESSSKPDGFRAAAGHDNVQASKSMDKLLREIKNKVRKSKGVWDALPRQVCNGISKDYSSQLCWNGTNAIRPDRNRTTEDNPESRSSFSKTVPNPLVTEQIIILQAITDKLRASYNGLDVQWVQETSDDLDFDGSGMGSGSGDLPTDLEDSDDDDPSGQIHPRPPFQHNSGLGQGQTHTTSSSSNPKFPTRPVPPILKPLPNHNDDNEDEDDLDIDEDDDEDDDHDDDEVHPSSNNNANNRNPFRNIDPFNNNNNNRDRDNGGFTIDNGPDGSDFAPMPPTVNKPVYPPFFPTEGTTSRTPSTPTTTIRTTTPTSTRRPSVDVTKKKHPSTSSGSIDIDEAGKAIAFFKLFSPIFASLVGKAFSFT